MMSESEDKSIKKYQHGKVFKKRFNFKDHYKYKNNLTSNVSVRPCESWTDKISSRGPSVGFSCAQLS